MRVALLVVCVAVAAPARGGVLDAGPSDRLALDLPKDAVVMGVGVVGSLLPEILFKQVAPSTCRWCGGPVGPDRFFYDGLTGALFTRRTSDRLSTLTGFVLAPAVAFTGAFVATGPYATEGAGVRSAVILLESVAVAGAITQSLKVIVGRKRPYGYFGHGGDAGEGSTYDLTGADANLSFPSGHTTVAAALGTGIATIATLQESPAAPWLWGAAGVLTVSTATLRMMAEKHFFTDALAGAAIGSACGVVVPLLHRRGGLLGGSTTSATVGTSGGLNLSISGSF